MRQERSAGDRHSDRAAKQYETQKADTYNCKKWAGWLTLTKCYAQLSFSNFIIATALANTALNKFHGIDLPALEDVGHKF